ncbi:hypothetical protein B0H17DRAFT_65454 [Mycena rosella]|uniref:Uncharacterized protein n=1 Tax=Mycena rosella TaxID=1033263 RepID=A0AAD7G9U2_MYCRO|nr:hypothetical protein B0H17DRAFT_65454 [Mycena rosella]
MSLADVNTFVRAHTSALRRTDLSDADWLVIDQKGLETFTCLVCEQYYDPGEDEDGGEGMTDEFRACRIPYEVAWLMIKNLHVGKVEFEDWVDEDAGMQDDGSWRWKSFPPYSQEGDAPSVEDIKRVKALQELRDGGHVD